MNVEQSKRMVEPMFKVGIKPKRRGDAKTQKALAGVFLLGEKPGTCEICGKHDEFAAIHQHHIKTRGSGAGDFLEGGRCNYVWLCPECHAKAHAANIPKKALYELAKIRDRRKS